MNLFRIFILIIISIAGSDAASLLIAENYIKAFEKLAKTNNTMILPSNTNDVSGLVAQAMAVYKTIESNNRNEETVNPNPVKGQSIKNEDLNMQTRKVHSMPFDENVMEFDEETK